MTELTEGRLLFKFGSSCRIMKYDDMSFYRNQFQNFCGGVKAVDIICLSEGIVWLIEIKDYRQYPRNKPQDLGDELAQKVRDTLAGLFAAKLNASVHDEKDFAKKVFKCCEAKVVLHLEQPEKRSKLFPQAIDPASVKQSLKQRLYAVDPHPVIVGKTNLKPNMDWVVTEL